ncbi:Cna B domain protein [Coriobacterium glomerans PW2]|uniref:Cna B domain protein n=1 Tax=Coriobacterium glomerans (strain ATCC 49209 / DSM 20642 / JCM 10262 / PW2) TaxID=700015 RepID=F2N702_CORGP|nr:SpaA isopeptide-forming pilin-related protein [Coriobacterium glomerans]AEB06341.1 Cna B domain protein [Coriobacterium glomerans PW2]
MRWFHKRSIGAGACETHIGLHRLAAFVIAAIIIACTALSVESVGFADPSSGGREAAVIEKGSASGEKDGGDAHDAHGDAATDTADADAHGKKEPDTADADAHDKKEPDAADADAHGKKEPDAADAGSHDKKEPDAADADSHDKKEPDAASGDKNSDGPSADDRPVLHGIKSINGERFTSDQAHGTFTVDLSVATGESGALVEDIMKVDGNSWSGDGADKGSYTFWKLSLKGTDDGTDYGTKQRGSGGNQSNTGTNISRVKKDADGEIEFIPLDKNGNPGSWTKVHGNGSDLQFVFYFLQDMPVGSNPSYVKFHVSDWFVRDFTPPGGRGSSTGRGIIVEVVDRDSAEQLAQSGTMYYYSTTSGVETLTADAVDLGKYQITGIEKFKAADQGNSRPWTSTAKEDANNPIASYTFDQMHDGTMAVKWDKDDPNHVIFTVSVSRTAQVSLEKRLTGPDSDVYQNKTFTFSAGLEVPDGNPLSTAYPAKGLADGATEVRVTKDASDPSRGEITGIAARPGVPITISGLPPETGVHFSEAGTPERDPSVFTTSFDNDVSHSTDGSATAREVDQTGDKRPQTVTTTNRVSSGQGKLTVTKKFTGLKKMTSQDRINLNESFLIESDGKAFPALLLNNCTDVTPSGGILDESADEVTYTWKLSRVATGPATLIERNYAVSSTDVAAQTRIGEGSYNLSDTVVLKNISDTPTAVLFMNEYGSGSTDLSVHKNWERTEQDEKLPVTVEVDWKGSIPGATGEVPGGLVGTYTIDAKTDWAMALQGQPTHSTVLGDITYSVTETAVGGSDPEDAGFTSTVSTDGVNAFTVTNEKTLKIGLRIKKVDEDGGSPLQGAAFTLSDEDGTPVGEETKVDSDGVAAFDDVRVGSYLISETCAPAGYQLAANPYRLNVSVDAVTVFVPDAQGHYPDTGVVVPASEDGAYRMTFSDRKAPNLPSTGLPGPAIAEAAAVTVAVAAGLHALASAFVRRQG